jgi:FkbM family methyltransferase
LQGCGFVNKYLYYLSSIYHLLTGVKNWPLVVRVFLKIAPPSPYLIELRKGGLKLKARGIMDIWSIKETFLDRFYERFGVRIEDGWTVVDIGGGIGDYTLFAAAANPHGKVFAFEPFPESFALLQQNLAANGATANAQAFAEAIWSQAGALKIDSTLGEPGQFISRSADDPGGLPTAGGALTAGGASTQVPSISMADAFARLEITRCDLMKIDCEGAEYPILFNTPEEVLGRVQRIVMEYHDSLTQYTHRDMQEFLTSKGYAVRVVQNYVHPDLGYLYAWRVQNQPQDQSSG